MALSGSPPPGSFARTGRGAKLLGGGRGGAVISTVSTLVVLGVLAAIFLLAPGARAVEHAFFSPQHMWQSFIGNPQQGYYSVGAAIWLNIRMFLIAEVLILAFALLIALIRQSAHPALFPIRLLATGYVDFFRGVPLILVILAIGLGVPALSLPVVSTQSNAVYGVTALVLSYSAYVSEVYRAGLNSVHQSQVAAARSLGLRHWQALRYVILPQAVRNIIPPLLNDFISLQKDTALVGDARDDRGQQGGRHLQRAGVQLLQLHGGRHLVPDPHHPARAVHRPADRAGPPPPPRRGHRMSASAGSGPPAGGRR